MNEQESMDAESAYGSEISSNSTFIIKKDSFKIEEPKSRRKTRCQSLKYKLREYMVLEAIFFLILVFLLIICYRISYQNRETHETILNIQSQLNSFQEPTGNDFMKQIITQNQETQRMILIIQSQLNSVQKHIESDIMKMKGETEKVDENEMEKTEATLEDLLEEIQMEPDVRLEQSQRIHNNTPKRKETHFPPMIPNVSTNSTFKRINAASLIAGATIDKSMSSSSSLSKSWFLGSDQSSLVLVDRPEPPANKAWCTSDKKPVLTVDLAKYIKPTAVSYQHSKWNGTIPDDAPKEYSVEVCLDSGCMTRKPLVSHCEYNQNGLQEQFCNVSYDSINLPVAKLQFRFHKNHGNTERTCVSLVRVYSETELVPEQNLRRLEDTTTCLNLKHHYHNYPIFYKYFTYHNCALLYLKGCCQECPECCEECDIESFLSPDNLIKIIFFVLGFPISFVLTISLMYLCEHIQKRQQ